MLQLIVHNERARLAHFLHLTIIIPRALRRYSELKASSGAALNMRRDFLRRSYILEFGALRYIFILLEMILNELAVIDVDEERDVAFEYRAVVLVLYTSCHLVHHSEE